MNIEDYISRTLFERSLLGIILLQAGDFHLQECNESFCRLVGYSLDELKQKTLEEITHREDWSDEKKETLSIINGEIDYCRVEKRFIHKNGDIVWTESVTTIAKDEGSGKTCIIKFIQDISEHRKSLRKIEQQEHFLRNITDAVPTLITVKDKEGKYTMVNLAAAEFYGMTVGDMEGLTDDDLGPHAGDPERIRRDDSEVLETLQDKFILEQTVRDTTGRSHVWQIYRRPIYIEHAQEYQVLTLCTDVTEYKKLARSLDENEKRLREEQTLMEEKIKIRTAEIDAQNAEMGQLLQTHKKLMSIVSQEVQAAWNVLEGQMPSSGAEAKAKEMLTSTVEAMLTLTQLESGPAPNPSKLSISRIEEELKAFFVKKIDGRKLNIELKIDDSAQSLRVIERYFIQTLEYLLLVMDQITAQGKDIGFEIRYDKHCRIFDFIFKNQTSEIAAANLSRFFSLEDAIGAADLKLSRALPAVINRLVKIQRGELRIDSEGNQSIRLILSLPVGSS